MSIYFEKTHQRSFGTFPLKGEELHAAIQHAAEVGYRSYDTAQMYENEADTGAALKATGIDRADLCITTKVNISNFTEATVVPSVGSPPPMGSSIPRPKCGSPAHSLRSRTCFPRDSGMS